MIVDGKINILLLLRLVLVYVCEEIITNYYFFFLIIFFHKILMFLSTYNFIYKYIYVHINTRITSVYILVLFSVIMIRVERFSAISKDWRKQGDNGRRIKFYALLRRDTQSRRFV